MQKEEMESLAREAGFTNTAVIPADQLVFDPSLRKYCEDNLCGNYGKNYSCPPECGTPGGDEGENRAVPAGPGFFRPLPRRTGRMRRL